MDDKLQFDLVSPERLVISERVDSVTIPGVEGDFGVLPSHSPVMAMIREGELIVESNGVQQLRACRRLCRCNTRRCHCIGRSHLNA